MVRSKKMNKFRRRYSSISGVKNKRYISDGNGRRPKFLESNIWYMLYYIAKKQKTKK